MLAIFENYSQTSDKPKSKIKPIIIKKGCAFAYDVILKYLKQEEYDDITTNKNFYEIYCCDRDYEISFSLLDDGGYGCSVNISVYAEKKRGRTRRKLKEIRTIINNLLVDYA